MRSWASLISLFLLIDPLCANPVISNWKSLDKKAFIFQNDWIKVSDTFLRESWLLAESAQLNFVANPREVGHSVVYDLVLTDNSLKKSILISLNARLSEENLNRYFQFERGILVHKKINGIQRALFFYGFKLDDVEEVLHGFTLRIANKDSISKSSRSTASEMIPSGPVREDSITSSQSQDLDYALGESFKSCYLEGVPEGIYAATVKPFTMAWGSLKSLRRSPSAWWNRSVDEWENFKERLEKFRISESFKSFNSLPPREKSKIACSIFGGIGGAGVLNKVAQKAVVEVSTRTNLPVSAGSRAVKSQDQIPSVIDAKSSSSQQGAGQSTAANTFQKQPRTKAINLQGVGPAELQRINQIEEIVAKATSVPLVGRTGTIATLFKNENIVPQNGVVHIVGASWTSADEWAIPLMARSDISMVLSQHDDLVKALSRNIKNETMLRKVWNELSTKTEYQGLVRDSHIRSFDQFKDEIRRRISINEGFERSTYQNVEGVVRPINGSAQVPKADLMIMNQPLLDDAGLHAIDHMKSDKVFGAVKSQMKNNKSLLWVNTEDLSLRVSPQMARQPMIEMPAARTSFRNSELVMTPDNMNYNYASDSFLIFFPN